jgi:hypothetical protein
MRELHGVNAILTYLVNYETKGCDLNQGMTTCNLLYKNFSFPIKRYLYRKTKVFCDLSACLITNNQFHRSLCMSWLYHQMSADNKKPRILPQGFKNNKRITSAYGTAPVGKLVRASALLIFGGL